MKCCIHRGANQIGGSCLEIESQGKRILLDLGLPLDSEKNSKELLPHIPGLSTHDPTLLGILVSHPHLDHYGLLKHVSENVPVWIGSDARNILKSASPFMPEKWDIPLGNRYKAYTQFQVGPFKITPYPVDHSAFDAYAFLVEADEKKILYSGDFRMHGRKHALMERLLDNPPKDMDALFLEGSSLGRLQQDETFPTETDVENGFVDIFKSTSGMALVHTSAQNIDRVVSIFRAAKRSGRRMVIDLYAAVILAATGRNSIPQSDWPEVELFVPQKQRVKILREELFDVLKQHSSNRVFMDEMIRSPEKRVLLFRPHHIRDLERGGLLEGATYTYSQWRGYWERDLETTLKPCLEKHSVPLHFLHTSGHASPADLKKFVEALKPKRVIPMHTEFPEKYQEMFQNVEILKDGEKWEIGRSQVY